MIARNHLAQQLRRVAPASSSPTTSLSLVPSLSRSPRHVQMRIPQRLPPSFSPLVQSRLASTRSLVRDITSRQDKHMKTDSPSASSRSTRETAIRTEAPEMDVVFPISFIALPLSQCPRKPLEFLKYQISRLRRQSGFFLHRLAFTVQSMPSFFKRPAFRARRRVIIPTAVSLTDSLNAAFAAGDIETLRTVCCPALFKRLQSTIQRRKKGEIVSWERLENHKKLWFPRIVSHRIEQPPDSSFQTSHIAIVALESTQRVVRRDAKTGETLPDGIKTQRKRENVVLKRPINLETFETGPWRVWGYLPETTPELLEQMDREVEQSRLQSVQQKLRSMKDR